MATTLERIAAIMVSELDLPHYVIKAESTVEDLGLDSLDVERFVMAVEEEFGVEIGDEDLEALHTVGELVALVDKSAAAR